MKILFLCSSFRTGGAERAFVSLLNILPLDKIQAHVMCIEPIGLFKDQLPSNITFEDAPEYFLSMGASMKTEYYKNNVSFSLRLRKCISIAKGKLFSVSKKLGPQQYFWTEAKNKIPENPTRFDAVVSFIDGFCNYYAIEKVHAPIKLLWVHNDYNFINANAEFDTFFFQKASAICTISDVCSFSLKKNFPTIANRVLVVENVSPASLIIKRSKEDVPMLDNSSYDVTFCSVGRFNFQKGYDMAIEAAALLKQYGLDFCWYIIGDGELKSNIEYKIKEYKLANNVKLLGLQANPYPYISRADIFVMTSRFEGKSIALDEAKILCKPIVSTKYPSVYDNIQDCVNGILVEQDPKSIAEGLLRLYNDQELRQNLINYLANHTFSNEQIVGETILKLLNINLDKEY